MESYDYETGEITDDGEPTMYTHDVKPWEEDYLIRPEDVATDENGDETSNAQATGNVIETATGKPVALEPGHVSMWSELGGFVQSATGFLSETGQLYTDTRKQLETAGLVQPGAKTQVQKPAVANSSAAAAAPSVALIAGAVLLAFLLLRSK